MNVEPVWADPVLRAQLDEALARRGPGYRPRTRHLRPDGRPAYTNRLVAERSPYLLQHAHNPVDWHPWGDEPFELARRLRRPVLLSVGYSTCHWCHVMEEESFEDEEVAQALNALYVPVKVDREERPDVDAVYMAAVQALTGQGGWPMTVWLTPERQPFFAGTYFPARDGDRGPHPGLLTLLRHLRGVYDRQPDDVTGSARRIAELLTRALQTSAAGALPTLAVVERAVPGWWSEFDRVHGGLEGAPKFPSSLPVRLLLREHLRTGDGTALEMAERTLQGMAAGGLRDQLDGGFHRYSTDERWLVPHFEKMLYDNALLASAYLEGRLATGSADFERVARGVLGWMDEAMSAPDGGFFSALDADSPDEHGRREEGLFHTWTPEEIGRVLEPSEAELFAACYGVTAAGNFEGRSVLHLARPLAQVARERGMELSGLEQRLAEARARLLAARARRPPPLRDEKVLACWNGLAIGAFAQAALALGDDASARRAARAARFVLDKMRSPDGRLRRSYAEGRAGGEAFLEDYAFVAAGLLDLFEATGEARWLEEAIALDGLLAADFEDEQGGFFQTSAGHGAPLTRHKPGQDGAEPSGNSVHARTLLRLHGFTLREPYRRRAERAISAFARTLERAPHALSELLLALEELHHPLPEVAIVAPGSRAGAAPLLDRLRAARLPRRALVVASDEEAAALTRLVPWLAGRRSRDGRAVAYVCREGACSLPTSDPDELSALLKTGRAGA